MNHLLRWLLPITTISTRRCIIAPVFHRRPVLFLGHLIRNSTQIHHRSMSNVPKTEEEWRVRLTPEQFRILREKGTEMPGTGEYDHHYPSKGVYTCVGCGEALFTAKHKFNSGCGWPAFWDAIPGKVERHVDTSFGRVRTEIVCATCGGHLGHVFKGEGYGHPTDERHCVNSVSIQFHDEKE